MTYRIEHAKPHGTQAGAYWYDIYQDDRLIARFWHDLRGDENGIEFIDGSRHPSPIPAVVDFLEDRKSVV